MSTRVVGGRATDPWAGTEMVRREDMVDGRRRVGSGQEGPVSLFDLQAEEDWSPVGAIDIMSHFNVVNLGENTQSRPPCQRHHCTTLGPKLREAVGSKHQTTMRCNDTHVLNLAQDARIDARVCMTVTFIGDKHSHKTRIMAERQGRAR